MQHARDRDPGITLIKKNKIIIPYIQARPMASPSLVSRHGAFLRSGRRGSRRSREGAAGGERCVMARVVEGEGEEGEAEAARGGGRRRGAAAAARRGGRRGGARTKFVTNFFGGPSPN